MVFPETHRLLLCLTYITINVAVAERMKYCEIIINRWVLIFEDFVVHLNHEI